MAGIALAGFEPGKAAEENARIKTLIEEVHPTSFKKSDARDYADNYTADVLYMPPNTCNLKGKDTIFNTLKRAFRQYHFRPELQITEIRIIDDFAYVIAEGKLTSINLNNSAEAESRLSYIFLLKKVDGNWKISHQMWNEKPNA